MLVAEVVNIYVVRAECWCGAFPQLYQTMKPMKYGHATGVFTHVPIRLVAFTPSVAHTANSLCICVGGIATGFTHGVSSRCRSCSPHTVIMSSRAMAIALSVIPSNNDMATGGFPGPPIPPAPTPIDHGSADISQLTSKKMLATIHAAEVGPK